MPKFDVVVGNPPYKNGLHLRFLELAYKISEKFIIWIAPSGNYLDEKGVRQQYKSINNLIESAVKEIIFLDGNSLFGVGLFLPMAITYIDKQNQADKILITNKISQRSSAVKSINDINKWLNYDTYPALKEKILRIITKDNILNHKNLIVGPYYVNIPIIRGHPGSDDFYTFFPKTYCDCDSDINGGRSGQIRNFLTFATHIEALNCITYLKTNFARFCLAILKISVHLDNGELKTVPWLDFTQEWTDEKLYKHFNLTQEEIDFIETNIPKYYND